MSSRSRVSEPQTEESPDARPVSPPPHTAHTVRGIHLPAFSTFQPREIKVTTLHPFTYVAWSCDGQKLAAVGIDKAVRIWTPETNFDARHASQYTGHDFDVDCIAWNPTHPDLFCTSSQRDRKIVFWDVRQSRSIQSYMHNMPPSQMAYAPNGQTLCFITTNHQLWFMSLELQDGKRKTWQLVKRDPLPASAALFNHAGTGIVLSHWRSNTLMIMDYPALTVREQPAAHVGGCMAVALDPRGKYLASGGHDAIVNLFDTTEWICANTVTCCDHSINALSFSYDGEYLAIANQGSYIDICATETGLPVHRITTPGPAVTVTWHPSKYVIAYCGHTAPRDGVAQQAYLSLFGPGV